MKIVGLSVENIKRLTAIEIVPDPELPIVTIGGKNGQGKSSVLDAIAYALGGKALVPEEPIRRGETSAKIKVVLDDLIVTRTFSRKPLPCSCGRTDEHDADCDSNRLGPTSTSLSVMNKEGAKYPSAQAVLDKLLGKLTFDPQTFADAKPEVQTEMLRKLLGIDTVEHDAKRKEVYSQRTEARRELAFIQANHAAQPHYPEAPAEELSPEESTAALQTAETPRREADQAEQTVRSTSSMLTTMVMEQNAAEAERLALEAKILKLNGDMIERAKNISGKETELRRLQKTADELKALVPDVSHVSEVIKHINDTNAKVRANKAKANLAKKVADSLAYTELLSNQLEVLDKRKADLLANAAFPITGLGIDPVAEVVTYRGIPLDQASSAERYRVGVAVGLASNPGINVLLLHNGNQLDQDSVRAIAEEAQKHDAQLWMEWVTGQKDEVAVYIEEGHVA